jgi:hypothetical protein
MLEHAKERYPELCNSEKAISIQICQLRDVNMRKTSVPSVEFEKQELYDLFQGQYRRLPRPQLQGHRPRGVVQDGERGRAHRQDLRDQHRPAPARTRRGHHHAA